LSFNALSFSASTRVISRWTSSAAGSRLATKARKSSRATNQPSTALRAMTDAEQTPRSISAISPNMSPSPSSATVSMPPPGSATCASTSPVRIRNAPREVSPWRTSLAPPGNDTARAIETSLS